MSARCSLCKNGTCSYCKSEKANAKLQERIAKLEGGLRVIADESNAMDRKDISVFALGLLEDR